MYTPFNPSESNIEMMTRIKNTFGDNTNYSVKAWRSPYDRNQGLSEYIKTNISLEQAMETFINAIPDNSSVEIVHTDDNEETAICIGGSDHDVHTPMWVCISELI